MNTFNQIIAALGGGAGPWTIGDDPELTVTLNPGTRSLIAALNAGVHITIYETSWNGKQTIMDCTAAPVEVGPYSLHTTAGGQRWFRQFSDGSWVWVTDCGTPTERYLKAFDAMMKTLGPKLH
ncbi:MAG TPA: hypothetical protein VE974_13470 [Thermoanaerobaculia bacterium]|nr:hypothetical protein [Thermoanaerobaculia bacterium]